MKSTQLERTKVRCPHIFRASTSKVRTKSLQPSYFPCAMQESEKFLAQQVKRLEVQKRALASEIEHRNQLTRESAGVPLKHRPQSALLSSRTTAAGWTTTTTTPRPPPPAAGGNVHAVRPQSAPYSQQRATATSSSRPVSAMRSSQPQLGQNTGTPGRQTASSDQYRPHGQPEFAKGAGPRHPEARPGSARMAAAGGEGRSRQVTVTGQPSGEHWRSYGSEPRADGALFNAVAAGTRWIPPQKMGIEASFLGRLERSA